jgi:hypothetical protein
MTSSEPSNLKVSITVDGPETQRATVSIGERTRSYDLVTLLDFQADLARAATEQAAQQSYWEAVTAEVSRLVDEFEVIDYAKWWAHARRYARYVIAYLGVRETNDTLRDYVVQMFCAETAQNPDERGRYADLAMRGLVLEREGTPAAAKRYFGDLAEAEIAEFARSTEAAVYGFVDQKGWTYDVIERKRLELAETKAKLGGFCRALEARSYKIREYADITGQKHGNTATYAGSGLPGQVHRPPAPAPTPASAPTPTPPAFAAPPPVAPAPPSQRGTVTTLPVPAAQTAPALSPLKPAPAAPAAAPPAPPSSPAPVLAAAPVAAPPAPVRPVGVAPARRPEPMPESMPLAAAAGSGLVAPSPAPGPRETGTPAPAWNAAPSGPPRRKMSDLPQEGSGPSDRLSW